jgi:SAM-dependent methyltransferase
MLRALKRQAILAFLHARRVVGRPSVTRDVDRMRSLWNRLSQKSELGYVSFLEKGAQWDEDEFRLVGERFVKRMMDRYNEFAAIPAAEADVLEIGCGVGRFILPLCSRFRHVTGVDISERMLAVATRRCATERNVDLILSDGASLSGVADRSQDFVITAGVFQHIVNFEVIANYLRESLRVLRPGGLLLFQFEANRISDWGFGYLGARITANKLDAALARSSYEICEVSREASDAVGSIVIVLRRVITPDPGLAGQTFKSFPIRERPWLSGVYDGLRTQVSMKGRQNEKPSRLTFYDPD